MFKWLSTTCVPVALLAGLASAQPSLEDASGGVWGGAFDGPDVHALLTGVVQSEGGQWSLGIQGRMDGVPVSGSYDVALSHPAGPQWTGLAPFNRADATYGISALLADDVLFDELQQGPIVPGAGPLEITFGIDFQVGDGVTQDLATVLDPQPRVVVRPLGPGGGQWALELEIQVGVEVEVSVPGFASAKVHTTVKATVDEQDLDQAQELIEEAVSRITASVKKRLIEEFEKHTQKGENGLPWWATIISSYL